MQDMRPGPPRLRDILLALIEMHPDVTGYDLSSIIDSNIGLFFSTTMSQIYPALAELRQDGLVEFRDETSEGGRVKKTYRITAAGEDALRAFFDTPVTYGAAYRDFGHVLLLSILLPYAPDVTIRARLSEARDFYAAQREHTIGKRDLTSETRFARLEGDRRDRYLDLWNPVMDYLVADYDLKIAWLDETLARFPPDR